MFHISEAAVRKTVARSSTLETLPSIISLESTRVAVRDKNMDLLERELEL